MEWNPSPVEDKIGIHFKNSDTLRLALIHQSYAQLINQPEQDNKRLQFLGEVIFNLVIADYLYHNLPYVDVGKFPALQDKILEGERLTKLWFQLQLGEAYPFLGLKQERYILRQRSKNPFSDALKALVGAINVDRGFSQTRNWLKKNLLAPLLEHHLKKNRKRVSADKQLNFLGEALFKAIVIDYLYRTLPYVSPSRLNSLSKKLITKKKQTEYINQLTTEDWNLISPEHEAVSKKSFTILLASIYLQFTTNKSKSVFRKMSQWFVEKFIDQDEIFRQAIALLLKDGKPQKWIIRNVMGYESKHYQEGRDRFHELVDKE